MRSNFGVLFDMDGVIVHSNPAHKKAINIFCDKHDIEIDDDYLKNNIYGRANKEWIPKIFGDISTERLKELADEKEQIFRDIFDPEAMQVPGVIRFIRQLKEQKVKMVVATSAPGENADFILNKLAIYDMFDAVLDSSHVTHSKPHPEPYHNAAKAIGLTAPECIVIEDSVSGVQSGLAAGAAVIGVATTHTPEELSDCHLVINDFENFTLDSMLSLKD
ncbi:HAD family hydrolase [Halalkalibaculum sp. DA384]|uniref:HAD family hydrolase n=1 Tax=Halalkalibaculum sp. DA384 TaxID=3373606 RepID=UPI003754847C